MGAGHEEEKPKTLNAEDAEEEKTGVGRSRGGVRDSALEEEEEGSGTSERVEPGR